MRRFKSSYSKSMLLATCFLLIILLFAICIIINQMAKLPIDSLNFVGVGVALCFILVTLLYSFFSQIRYVCDKRKFDNKENAREGYYTSL